MTWKDISTHIAWDGGVVTNFRVAVGMPPRTTKTKCGRRVTLGRVDNERPSCPACIRGREDETRALAEWHRRMKGVE